MEEPTREDEDASARPESGDSHGDLITRFLLSGNDGEQSPMHSPLHSDDEPRRKRSPSAGSDAPKPKKMPRAKVRPPASVHGLPEAAASSPVLMPLVPKARCVAPPARIFQQAMVAQAPPRVPRQPKPPSGQPLEDAKIYEAKWAAQQSEVECFYNQFAAWTATSAQAQEILARHCARLGPVAAASLEEAVAAAAAMNSHCDKAQVWYFLQSEEERGSFSAVKTSVVTHYTQRGRTRQTDESVREDLGILECSQQLGHEVFEIDLGHEPPELPRRPLEKGDFRLLPITEVRFAHNDQSEHFVNCAKDCSILQLAVELVTGLKSHADIPPFNVCWHDGDWYCRSGNRRLAAYMLAATFAPSRFSCVWANVVATDKVFLQGGASGRPKLTTHLNGPDCRGQWLLVKETGEAVGVPSALEAPPYGADLLALLPQPTSALSEF